MFDLVDRHLDDLYHFRNKRFSQLGSLITAAPVSVAIILN